MVVVILQIKCFASRFAQQFYKSQCFYCYDNYTHSVRIIVVYYIHFDINICMCIAAAAAAAS